MSQEDMVNLVETGFEPTQQEIEEKIQGDIDNPISRESEGEDGE